MLLQSLVALMSTPHAKHTDPALLLEYLLLVKNWLLEPQGGGQPTVFSTFVGQSILWGSLAVGVRVANEEPDSCPTLDCSCPTALGAGGIEAVHNLSLTDRQLQDMALMLQTLSAAAS